MENFSFVVLIIELTILFFLSRRLIKNLFALMVLLSRSRSFSISILTLLLFPGTVIHELSHLFTAEILGVRTGKLTLAPEAIRGSEIQAGSVSISKTGPFRRVLIGLSPLFSSLVAVTVLSSYPLTILSSYLFFAISNSMFPSKFDMQDSPGPIIAALLLFAAAYATGIRLTLPGQLLEPVVTAFALVLAVNGILLLTLWILLAISGFRNIPHNIKD